MSALIFIIRKYRATLFLLIIRQFILLSAHQLKISDRISEKYHIDSPPDIIPSYSSISMMDNSMDEIRSCITDIFGKRNFIFFFFIIIFKLSC